MEVFFNDFRDPFDSFFKFVDVSTASLSHIGPSPAGAFDYRCDFLDNVSGMDSSSKIFGYPGYKSYFAFGCGTDCCDSERY